MNIIDIAVIAIVLIVAAASARKGFLLTVFNIAAYVLSAVAAKIFSPYAAQYIYSEFLSKRFISELNDIIPSGSVSGELSEIMGRIMDSLPPLFSAFVKQFGLLPDFSQTAADRYTVEVIEQDYLRPIVTKIVSFFVIVLLFILFSVILKIIFRFINSRLTAKKHIIIRSGNMLLGAALGLIKGLVPAGVICAVLDIFAPLINPPQLAALVESSFFCKIIAALLH